MSSYLPVPCSNFKILNSNYTLQTQTTNYKFKSPNLEIRNPKIKIKVVINSFPLIFHRFSGSIEMEHWREICKEDLNIIYT